MTHILRDCALRTNLHLTNEKFAVHRTMYFLVKTKIRVEAALSKLTVLSNTKLLEQCIEGSDVTDDWHRTGSGHRRLACRENVLVDVRIGRGWRRRR